ncbi:rhodanese-like domain-containing protein [Zoogloea sp.]|jgi:rhodanese-related sulfurtransferase|uniref:rhodanese-like domain-containing protein n=1 Tax=Zoogloea sp. TaxID=49181 RepID=UPI001ACD251C|nr:rhodanese-like domain-containing protein [Zoogloea sp.]MBK6653390.1 sulfurtransferase [Zoogloea sp.]MBK7847192.1 sulfurtransferase [Zoogloea sp.]MBN8281921.1 sulfurtransferase [Zoogloea sp.]MBP7444416.1 sulfurtransferase [Zoogloea sp.]HOY01110.1 rhodanese-like domain-containing protein [Zoogloea sp.]
MKTPHDLVMAAKALIREVSLDEAEQAIRDADVLLDVREADEFAAGHLPGAVHVSRGMLEFKLGGTPELSNRDLKIVLYCKTGGRAALAARSLQEMGYLHVQSLAGGFDTWAAAGRPVAKPSLPAFD